MKRLLNILVTILFVSLLANLVGAGKLKFDVPSVFTTPLQSNMTCSNTYLGYPISSIAVLDHVETGIGTSALVISVTLPIQVSINVNMTAFVLKGATSMPNVETVGIFYWNDTLKNVTSSVVTGSGCGLVQNNRSAIANVSNNFEGWFAINVTACNSTYTNQTVSTNLSVWTKPPKTITFKANQTSWFKVVTNYKPVLGYTAYDTYINVSDFVPCFAWQNTSYSLAKNLTGMNGWGVTQDWLPLFLSANFTKNLTASLANGSDVIPADGFNGQYPVAHYNFNQTGGLTVFSPNITAGSNWSGNASIYYNGTPVSEAGALVFKNFTGIWLFADMNDSRGINAMTLSPSQTPTVYRGDNGVCKFGRCMEFQSAGSGNASVSNYKMNASQMTLWYRGSRSAQGQNIYFSGGDCDFTSASGLLVYSTSGTNFFVSLRGGNPGNSCGTPTLNSMFELMLTVDAGGTTCFLNGVNTSFWTGTSSSAFTGIQGISINRGGVNNGLYHGGCGGWLEYNGGTNVTDLFAIANFSTGREGLALFNMSSGITATSEWGQFDVQIVPNIAPLVTLISPADATKFTTGTISFQFNASDGDNVTFLSATLWRNATNASYLALVAANFTATFNITTHPVGNFTWNVSVDDGVDWGNSTKRTYMVVPANTAPTVTLVAPLDANVSNTAMFVNYSATITDGENTTMQWCAARLNMTVIGNVTSVTSPGSFNVSTNRTEGNYSWNIICSDGLAEASGSARNIKIVPTDAPPSVTLNTPANAVVITAGFINFTYTPADLSNATLDCTLLRNTTNLSYQSGVSQVLNNFSITSTTAGNYSWNTTCWDGTYSTTSTVRTFMVSPALTVLNVSPQHNIGNISQNTPYVFWFNVTGNTTQANCTLFFNNTFMKSANYSLPRDNANLSVTGNGELSRGAKNWTINCTSDGSAVTPFNTFRVLNTPPVITGLSFTPEFFYINTQTVNATVRATDFDNDLINYTTVWSGGDSDDVLNRQTAGSNVTSGNTTVSIQVWTYGSTLIANVTAIDDFDNGANSTNASFSSTTSNSVPKITEVGVKDIVNTMGGTIRWSVDVSDADGSDTPTNAYLRFSQYNLTLQKTGGLSGSRYLFNFTIGNNNRTGNFSWNLTVTDDRNVTEIRFIDRNVTITNVTPITVTGRTGAYQKHRPIRIGRARNEQFEYLRQIAVTNRNLVSANISVNTTLPSTLNNVSVNVTDSNGNIITFSINTSDYHVNWTINVSANTTITYNVTYNLSVLQTINYTDQCDGEGTGSGTCTVSFRIANNHTSKLNNLSFILQDSDLPHWDGRGSISVVFKLIGGSGGGSYEKWLVNGSVNESVIYANYTYTNGTTQTQGGGAGIQSEGGGDEGGGEDSGTGTSTNIAKAFINSSIIESNFTSLTNTSANLTINNYEIGSLIVKGLDIGSSSTYELTAEYAWSVAGSSGGETGGSGGGGAGMGTTSAALNISEGNESYKIETDRGNSKYELFANVGQTRQKTVKITNIGSVAGIVKVSCESASPANACNAVVIDETSIPLVPKQFKTVSFSATVPKIFEGKTYEFNIVVQSENEKITGRLPVMIEISNLGALFTYGEKWTGKFVVESPVDGGRDLKVPVIVVAFITLLVVAGSIGYLFAIILKAGTKLGWSVGFVTGLLFAVIVPLFA